MGKYIGAAFLIFWGVVATSIGLYFKTQVDEVEKNGQPVQGVVTAREQHSDGDGNMFVYQVKYTDLDHIDHITSTKVNTNFKELYKIGDSVDVLYDRLHPDEAFIENEKQYLYRLPILIGALVIAGGMFLFIYFRRRDKKRQQSVQLR